MSYPSLRENLKNFVSPERAEFESAETEREFAPVREAEAQLTATIRELRNNAKAEIVANRPDPVSVPVGLQPGERMTLEDAQKFNAAELKKFVDATPEFFPGDENINLLTTYLLTNGVNIANEKTFQFAYERLQSFNLFEARPEESAPESEPTITEPQPITSAPPKHIGIDGRKYSEREVYLMSSEEFRKAFGLYGNNLPTVRNFLTANHNDSDSPV